MIESFLFFGVLAAGIGTLIYSKIRPDSSSSSYEDMTHCKVPEEWSSVRDKAWNSASYVLAKNGLYPKTKCRKIKIEKGVKFSEKTSQWGRKTTMNGEDYWYAGLSYGTSISVVGTPDGKPYSKSFGILRHEIAESILKANDALQDKSIEERNLYLWKLGL